MTAPPPGGRRRAGQGFHEIKLGLHDVTETSFADAVTELGSRPSNPPIAPGADDLHSANLRLCRFKRTSGAYAPAGHGAISNSQFQRSGPRTKVTRARVNNIEESGIAACCPSAGRQ
jgi:hypothetical protein